MLTRFVSARLLQSSVGAISALPRLARGFASPSDWKEIKPLTEKSASLIEQDAKYGAPNYAPLEVVLERGKGVFLWDVDGTRYYDFLSAYSAVSQGHCHPKIVDAMQKQCAKLPLTSRAFYTSELADTVKFVADFFGYEKAILMNGGVEAVETAMKMCRKWAYEVKGVPANKAKLIFAEENFHGRTLGVISASTDPDTTKNFGPLLPGIETVPYNDLAALDKALSDPNVAAFIVEPIQGEAGVFVPDMGYLRGCQELCKKHNCLFVADEIQTGLARTGKMLAVDHEGIKPDVVTLGKALSGGMMPISAVLARADVMDMLSCGTHGSTYGGNPLACQVVKAALSVIKDENIVEHTNEMGEIFRAELANMDCPYFELIRGKGLLNAVIIKERKDGRDATYLCYLLRDQGILAKYTHKDIIRFAPPLCITEEQIMEVMEGIKRAMAIYMENDN